MYSRDLDPGAQRVTDALLRGLIVHKFLELWHGEGKHPNQAFQEVRELFPTYEAQIITPVALVYMLRYVNVYKDDPVRFQVIATEKRYTIPYTTPHGHQVWLDGIIDMIVEDIVDGVVDVWDNKTDSKNLWSPDVVMLDRQLNSYTVILHLLALNPQRLTVNQIKTKFTKPESVHKAAKEDLFGRHSVTVTPASINSWMIAIGKRIDQILEAEYIHKNLGAHCIYCPFRQACQMELKGVDPEPYLRNNFGSRSEAQTTGGGDLRIILDIEEGIFDA